MKSHAERVERNRPIQDPKTGTVAGQKKPDPVWLRPERSRLPVSHADYWLSRIRRRTYKDADDQLLEAPEWSVRLRLEGRDVWFNLSTGNKEAAAAKARDIYLHAKANGIGSAIHKFKPGSGRKEASEVTVGDWFEAVEDLRMHRPKTLRNYKAALRTIVSGILHVRDDGSRFDYRSHGVIEWRNRIDATRLSRIDAASVVRWQREFVARAGSSPASIASARRTANSYVRQARALFSNDVCREVGLDIPEPRPFADVPMMEGGSTRYISKINVADLVSAAKAELRRQDPEAYKAWLLTFFGALRKQEADLLEWRQVDWSKGGLRIEATEWFTPKTESSTGLVCLDPPVMAELKRLKSESDGDFVLVGAQPRPESDRQFYRAEKTWVRLYEWLRSHGISANKPVHELRKEAGAVLATKKGIYATSRFLRHADLTTTVRHYADQKERITTGLGSLLTPATKKAKKGKP
ncbi:MAG TPA: site-specific integrase [Verrucomicrobia bacterium]|nr:site-specific integrase [Verrucomicrobiota bacterium]